MFFILFFVLSVAYCSEAKKTVTPENNLATKDIIRLLLQNGIHNAFGDTVYEKTNVSQRTMFKKIIIRCLDKEFFNKIYVCKEQKDILKYGLLFASCFFTLTEKVKKSYQINDSPVCQSPTIQLNQPFESPARQLDTLCQLPTTQLDQPFKSPATQFDPLKCFSKHVKIGELCITMVYTPPEYTIDFRDQWSFLSKDPSLTVNISGSFDSEIHNFKALEDALEGIMQSCNVLNHSKKQSLVEEIKDLIVCKRKNDSVIPLQIKEGSEEYNIVEECRKKNPYGRLLSSTQLRSTIAKLKGEYPRISLVCTGSDPQAEALQQQTSKSHKTTNQTLADVISEMAFPIPKEEKKSDNDIKRINDEGYFIFNI